MMNTSELHASIKLYLFIFLLSSLLLNCGPKKEDYILDDGLYFEKLPEGNEDYDSDNEIYTIGRSFIYNYYILKGKDTLKVKISPVDQDWEHDPIIAREAWEFTKLTIGDSIITHLQLTAVDPIIYKEMQTNPTQTLGKMSYQSSGKEMHFAEYTGIIENKMNIWIHPHRMRYFSILEINPFPYIQYPYEVGHEWEWELKIGWFWGNSKWKKWQGNLENKFVYKITDNVNLTTPLGELETFVVDAIAISDEGTSFLRSYFNSEYGFVKLDYTNIDSSKTIIELIEVKTS